MAVTAPSGPAVGLFLLAWLALALALERRAERRIAVHDRFSWALAATAALAGACAVAAHAAAWDAARCGAACIGLVVAASGDARTGYLFDAVTLPTAATVAGVAVLSGCAGDAAAGVALLVVTFGGIVFASRGRLMGLGDVKAMYAVGAALGPFEALVAVFAACVGGIVLLGLRHGLQRGAEIRFGPPLALGATFAAVAGDPIAHRMLGV